jgi:hypothetical protein
VTITSIRSGRSPPTNDALTGHSAVTLEDAGASLASQPCS